MAMVRLRYHYFCMCGRQDKLMIHKGRGKPTQLTEKNGRCNRVTFRSV